MSRTASSRAIESITDHVCTDNCIDMRCPFNRDLPTDIARLSKKYALLQSGGSLQKNDPLTGIIESKDQIIDDQHKMIENLKQEITDLTLCYNEKLEQLRVQHKKELCLQHAQYVRKLKSKDTMSNY